MLSVLLIQLWSLIHKGRKIHNVVIPYLLSSFRCLKVIALHSMHKEHNIKLQTNEITVIALHNMHKDHNIKITNERITPNHCAHWEIRWENSSVQCRRSRLRPSSNTSSSVLTYNSKNSHFIISSKSSLSKHKLPKAQTFNNITQNIINKKPQKAK